ncbi:MAG: hypothetical protein U0936_20225 [Planctomycetaceae bacterium]
MPVLYHLLGHRAQNRMLLVASYTFYGMWDLAISVSDDGIADVDFAAVWGIFRSTNARTRKLLLTLSVVVNGGASLFFKYFNFFVGSAFGLLEWIGLPTSSEVLQIVLPVGISFYTFQTMCYTIDVYRGKQ